ncbi:MAG: hypothetical protein B7Z20_13870 [Sphingobium sp. 32-64-5]|nr:MAG: hypothetical protein B7Z20_13870 [Sphingobium sp. 32-64-5]
MTNLSGKVAVVIGAAGAGNMGQHIAQTLADAGAKVVVAGRKADELSRFAGVIAGDWALCDLSKKAEPEALRLIRDAENTWREEGGIPRVGEGWVSETTLFYQIKAVFADVEVIQHASPQWLGRQHLDIFIPALRIGVEYQGSQHDMPVAFFGGEEAFAANQKRDKTKKAKCTRHGVRLVYVREGYSLDTVVAEIREAAAR